MPEDITAFVLIDSFEDAIRKAVSVGGDSDTIAAITGSIAEPFYRGVPLEIQKEVGCRLEHRLMGLYIYVERVELLSQNS